MSENQKTKKPTLEQRAADLLAAARQFETIALMKEYDLVFGSAEVLKEYERLHGCSADVLKEYEYFLLREYEDLYSLATVVVREARAMVVIAERLAQRKKTQRK